MDTTITINDFLEFYKEAKPGKYWQLPKDKKNMREQMLLNENYYAGAKNDGEWARLIVGDGYTLIQSRNISKKTGTYTDKTPLLPHVVKDANMIYKPGTVLLGELCFDDITKTSKDVGSILRCLPEKAIKRQKEGAPIVFKVFDVLAMHGVATHEFKAEDRKSIIENMPVGGSIKLTEFSDNPKELLQRMFENGGEGIVLMNRSEPYKFGNKKAWHSIKIKKELPNFEAKAIRLTQPNMIYDGTELQTWKYWQLTFADNSVEYIEDILHRYLIQGKEIVYDGKTVKQAIPLNRFYFKKWPSGVVLKHEGKEIAPSSGLNDDEREFLSKLSEEELKDITVVYSGMEITEDKSIRHPYVIRLRDEA